MRRPKINRVRAQILARVPQDLLDRWLRMVIALGMTESALLREIVQTAVQVFEESEAEKCPQKPTPSKSTSTR